MSDGTKGFIDTSWDEAEFVETPLGNAAFIDIGNERDPHRPVVILVRFPPGAEVPPHYHDSDYCSIVVEGSIEVTRKQHRVGDVRIVEAGTGYGPLVAGPNGCKVIDIFADRTGVGATFFKKDDPLSQRFIALQEELRASGVLASSEPTTSTSERS